MQGLTKTLTRLFGLTVGSLILTGQLAQAETLRIAQQYGFASLPLMVTQQQELITKKAAEMGIPDLDVEWSTFSGGTTMNEALVSGNLDIAAAGVTPLLTIWDKTKGSLNVKGLVSLGSIPLVMTTNKPQIKTLKDLSASDKIALPAVKVSVQAAFLQMASAATFGQDGFSQLDTLTVSMPHPDAATALMSGGTEITAHITSSPFVEQELAHPGIHKVVSSHDVLGSTTNVALYTSEAFYNGNPKLVEVVASAVSEAMEFINRDKPATARIYKEMTGTSLSEDLLLAALNDETNVFTTVPQGFMKYAGFLHERGALKNKPESWKDIFFSVAHSLSGS